MLYEHYIEPSAKQRIRLLAEDLDYDLWDDDDWRALCKPYVPCAELDDDSIPWETVVDRGRGDEFRRWPSKTDLRSRAGAFTYNDELSPDMLREYHDLRMLPRTCSRTFSRVWSCSSTATMRTSASSHDPLL